MNRKTLLLATLALFLVVLGNWLTEQGVRQVDKRLAAPAEAQQDYYLHDFSITALDEQGQPEQRLQAASLSHYNATARSELQQPQLVVYQQGKVAWQLAAERGELDQQQDEIWLQGKVELHQPQGAAPLKLTTSALRLQAKEGRATTDQAVTLTQGRTRIDAVGMRLEQQGQRLTLLSQVRGRYASLAP